MEFPVEHEAFRVRRLVVRTAGFWKGPRVLIDGLVAAGKRHKYQIQDDVGRERSVVLKPIFLDPIPRLQIDAEPLIELVRPLRWYEWAWMSLPVLLIFTGGGLGALFGVLAVWTSTRIFRSDRGLVAKYVLSGLASVVAITLFTAGATAMHLAMGRN